ncbi:MAG: class I SAM-dependent DNA methyltransferase, partial [bacterium]|nr:class I SAM-dependent DNA methyltransferase [bacterium]
DISTDILVLEDRRILGIKEKIERIGKPLKYWNVKIYRGVITGFNEAFIIDSQTREKILENCRTREERERTEKIIKPVLRGRDIKRYYYEWNGLWLIVIPAGWTNQNREKYEPEEFFKNSFHSIYSYLKNFENYKSKGKGLYNRDDQGDYWWELRHCDYYPEFEKEKIVWQEIVYEPCFAYDKDKYYVEATGFIMVGQELKYILGVLNSRIAGAIFKRFYSGGGLGEKGYRYKKYYLENFPIPLINELNMNLYLRIIELVDRVIQANPKNNQGFELKKLDEELEEMIFVMYQFDEEKAKYIYRNL